LGNVFSKTRAFKHLPRSQCFPWELKVRDSHFRRSAFTAARLRCDYSSKETALLKRSAGREGIWTLARKMTSFRFSENVFALELELGLELAEICFWSNVHSGNCARSRPEGHTKLVFATTSIIIFFYLFWVTMRTLTFHRLRTALDMIHWRSLKGDIQCCSESMKRQSGIQCGHWRFTDWLKTALDISSHVSSVDHTRPFKS